MTKQLKYGVIILSVEFIDVMSKNSSYTEKRELENAYDGMSDEYKRWVKKDTFVDFMLTRDRSTFLWHDYEAGGTDAVTAAPMQFAAIRTDLYLNVIDVPTDIYCKLHGDKLPHPVAIKITNINPMHCLKEGLAEPLFFRLVNEEMSISNTCVVGYNSMGYDETISRFGFWRNLLPVYAREFANGNSRWDLLNVTASFYALGVNNNINWPVIDDKISLKLENLAKANNVIQENAHNAIDDCKALIDWARLLKKGNERLWTYLYENRTKKNMGSKISKGKVGVYVKAGFGYANKYRQPVLIVGQSKVDKNKYVAVKLDEIEGLRELWKLSVDEIKDRLFSTSSELESKSYSRPPIEQITINKCPAFIPLEWVESSKELSASVRGSDYYKELSLKIMSSPSFIEKLVSVFDVDYDDGAISSVEVNLYGSGFPSKNDERNIAIMKGMSVVDAFSRKFEWDNKDYELLWQRCRHKLADMLPNYSSSERKEWSKLRSFKASQDFSDSKKHEYVNTSNVRYEIENSGLNDELLSGYESFLVEYGY